MNDKCKLMTKKDLARYIGKSIRTVERWVSNGSLPPANKSFGRLENSEDNQNYGTLELDAKRFSET